MLETPTPFGTAGDRESAMLNRAAVVVALTATLAGSAVAAPTVQLSIRGGRVWLIANRATAAEILAEWSRIGATRIVNRERLAGPPLTLDLRDVAEAEALDIIMRSAGGFVAVGRTEIDASGQLSRFSQVVVVPAQAGGGGTVAPPAVTLPAAAPPIAVQTPVLTPSGSQRLIGPDGLPVPDDQDDAPPPPPTPPVGVKPGGSMPPGFSEPANAVPPPGAPRPGVITLPTPPKRPGGSTSP
jgi:hypothetical protein